MLNLIAKSSTLRILLASRVVSEVGTWLAYIGLAVAVYDATGSPVWVSVLLLLDLLPATFAGIALSPLIDRLDRKRLLIGSELVAGAAFVVLTFEHSLVPLLIFAAVAGTASAMFKPAQSAVVPQVIADEDLPAANSLLMSVQSAALILGPPLAGVLVGLAGVGVIFGLNALSYIGSAIVLTRLPSLARETNNPAATEPYRQRMRAGLQIFAPPVLRGVLVSWAIAAFSISLINVCEIIVAKQVFHAGDGGYGVLAACSGIGLLGGSLVSSRLYERFAPTTVYAAALIVAGTLVAAAAVSPWFTLALPLFAAGAAANSVSIVGLQLLIQRNAASEVIGQAFGVLGSCSLAASSLGLISAGVVAELVGGRAVWVIGGVLAVAAAFVVTAIARADEPVRVVA